MQILIISNILMFQSQFTLTYYKIMVNVLHDVGPMFNIHVLDNNSHTNQSQYNALEYDFNEESIIKKVKS